MPDEMTIIGTYFNMPEALMAQGKLQSEGIQCALDQEDIAGSALPMPATPVNLSVEKKDEEAARAILAEGISEAIVDEETGEEYRPPKCPKCQSLEVSMETVTSTHRGVFSASVRSLDLWKCKNCQHEWIAEKD